MVYVDRLRATTPKPGWRFSSSCHLIADSNNELDRFAIQIGLRVQWRQTSISGVVHYDLTELRRRLAVRRGAVELSNRDFIVKCKEVRCVRV